MKFYTKAISLCAHNYEALFQRGLVALESTNYQRAIQDFSEIIENAASFKKNVYILLSIAFRRAQNLNESLKVLGKGIQKFSKFVEAYIARG